MDTQGNAIGTLTDVLQPGGADVLVFSGRPKGSLMAPHLKKLVKEITKDTHRAGRSRAAGGGRV